MGVTLQLAHKLECKLNGSISMHKHYYKCYINIYKHQFLIKPHIEF